MMLVHTRMGSSMLCCCILGEVLPSLDNYVTLVILMNRDELSHQCRLFESVFLNDEHWCNWIILLNIVDENYLMIMFYIVGNSLRDYSEL